ncbi:uncharacterized protein SPPG_04631 [Spizellomyces punctatus DAOM BR117]|uniref:AAA+ ATPase domain-containing protein n=1 Tax=Spizellomyces punctatus (strain DAOM BR117) TaxID=645134 RepID=A0A0L0HFP3_SPIPD|nr:uncharacterized protein SPPG_04631 [Spizellomyces punctatus DAOM BR117]KND00306.1 hypothetical protein SPPG_04631 [Spizellomyces punctatus DAOM BR117]|eukprot:XP_016608345.1 hypothetical protein SPPG_04631 [Spizellomyces punctatus DAOM BR117]
MPAHRIGVREGDIRQRFFRKSQQSPLGYIHAGARRSWPQCICKRNLSGVPGRIGERIKQTTDQAEFPLLSKGCRGKVPVKTGNSGGEVAGRVAHRAGVFGVAGMRYNFHSIIRHSRWSRGGIRGMAHWADFGHKTKSQATAGEANFPHSTSASKESHVRPVVAFRRNFIPHSQLQQSFASETTYPYYISDANRRTLKAITHVELSPYASRNIILASPHPGAPLFLENTVKAVAFDLGADVLTLDYHTMLQAVREISGKESPKPSGRERSSFVTGRTENPEYLQVSESFSPAMFNTVTAKEAEGIDDEDEEFDDEHDIEEDDDDVDYHAVASGSRNLPWVGNYRASEPTHPLVVTFNVGERNGKTEDCSTMSGTSEAPSSNRVSEAHISPIAGLPIKISVASAPSPPTALPVDTLLANMHKDALGKGSHYEEPLTSLELREASKALVDFIKTTCSSFPKSLLTNLRYPRRLIIYVKDMTDILEVGGESGKRVVLSLLDVVARVRHNIPVVLIGGCSPTLLHPGNLDRTVEFYEDLFEGSVRASGRLSPEQERIWTEGTLFRTPLDRMTKDFEKVEMLPPAPYLLSDSENTATTADKEKLGIWLETMQKDLRRRIKEVNWQRVEAICGQRGVTIRGLDVSAVTTEDADRNVVPPSLQGGLHLLEQSIWPRHRVERLVSLAMGFRLELASGGESSGRDDHMLRGPLDLSARHFAEALQLMRNGASQRPSSKSVEGAEQRVVPARTGEQHEDANAVQEQEQAAKTEREKRLVSTVVNPDAIKTSFNDLILPNSTKLMLQTVVTLPLLRPDYFAQGILSRNAINGVLLFGPPGTGKTMLAKAVAKSSGARFMSVALSDVFDKYVGEGEKNVKAVFTLARKLSPCVVFLDEVDALFGARRSDAAHASRREIINEFMSEWDGLTSNNAGILIMGATNRPFDLDDAILRRMPRRVLVDLPNEEQRAKIINLHLRGEDVDASLDVVDLAKRTASYSGSDLKNLCVAAATARVKESLVREAKAGTAEDEQATTEDLLKELDKFEDIASVVAASATTSTTVGRTPPMGRKSASRATTVPSAASKLGPLKHSHFDVALKEVPPSLTDEMQTLVELRKWDEMYGEGAGRRKGSAKMGWGFDMGMLGQDGERKLELERSKPLERE